MRQTRYAMRAPIDAERRRALRIRPTRFTNGVSGRPASTRVLSSINRSRAARFFELASTRERHNNSGARFTGEAGASDAGIGDPARRAAISRYCRTRSSVTGRPFSLLNTSRVPSRDAITLQSIDGRAASTDATLRNPLSVNPFVPSAAPCASACHTNSVALGMVIVTPFHSTLSQFSVARRHASAGGTDIDVVVCNSTDTLLASINVGR